VRLRVYVLALWAMAVALGCVGCRAPRPVSDLVATFGQARKQPSEAAFSIANVALGDVTKRAVIARHQTRLTYHVTVPKHATFLFSVGLEPSVWKERGEGVLFLIGVSDGNSYRTKQSVVIDPFTRADDRKWRDLEVNLEEFAGLTVDIVLNTRQTGAWNAGERLLAAWGEPVVIAR
jgi:hypothetical protein